MGVQEQQASPYEVLGVGRGADAEVVRAAYRALTRKLHPDSPSGDSVRMAEVNDAYAILSDPVRRAALDADLGAVEDPFAGGGPGDEDAWGEEDVDEDAWGEEPAVPNVPGAADEPTAPSLSAWAAGRPAYAHLEIASVAAVVVGVFVIGLSDTIGGFWNTAAAVILLLAYAWAYVLGGSIPVLAAAVVGFGWYGYAGEASMWWPTGGALVLAHGLLWVARRMRARQEGVVS